MSQITNIGFIGTGRIGTYHAKKIEHNIPEASVVLLWISIIQKRKHLHKNSLIA
ncbi:MAG: hypothetical protein CM1200mP38_6970 [Dehalococcoidia bacterium]|nr:MAG: hypothetical protein CM1200mP38_6970 [Dehalococcoidia bacterium]